MLMTKKTDAKNTSKHMFVYIYIYILVCVGLYVFCISCVHVCLFISSSVDLGSRRVKLRFIRADQDIRHELQRLQHQAIHTFATKACFDQCAVRAITIWEDDIVNVKLLASANCQMSPDHCFNLQKSRQFWKWNRPSH